MENLIEPLLTMIFGGSNSVLALATIIIGALLWDRSRLVKELERKNERIDKIVEDYHAGNMTLAEALSSLKSVMYDIRTKL